MLGSLNIDFFCDKKIGRTQSKKIQSFKNEVRTG